MTNTPMSPAPSTTPDRRCHEQPHLPPESQLITSKAWRSPIQIFLEKPATPFRPRFLIPFKHRIWKADDVLAFVMLEQLQGRTPDSTAIRTWESVNRRSKGHTYSLHRRG